MSKEVRILRKWAVFEKTGVPFPTMYRLIKQKRFPAQIKLSERCSGWLESEIDAWIQARAEASRGTKVEAANELRG